MKLNLTRPLVVFDLETTGLDLVNDRIIQISYIKIYPDGKEERENLLVYPQRPIPDEVSELTGITTDLVEDAPTFEELAPRLNEVFKGCDFAGFNSNHFDIPMLAEEFLRAEIDFDFSSARLIDAQTIFHKMEKRNLAAAYKFYCGRKMEDDFEAHRADQDAEATYRVLLGELERYSEANQEEPERVLPNDMDYLANLKTVFGLPVVVAVNRFVSDTDAELALIQTACAEHGAEVSLTEVWAHGGAGGEDLARKVVAAIDTRPNNFAYAYDANDSIRDKLRTIATRIYGASGVEFSAEAQAEAASLEKLGLDKLPVCVAKTQYSFSDNPKLLGCPEGFTITVRSLTLSAGAGFIVAVCGSIMKMPGLPKVPSAEKIDVDAEGNITGLF